MESLAAEIRRKAGVLLSMERRASLFQVLKESWEKVGEEALVDQIKAFYDKARNALQRWADQPEKLEEVREVFSDATGGMLTMVTQPTKGKKRTIFIMPNLRHPDITKLSPSEIKSLKVRI